jgi:hypothetical protein
MLAAEKQTRLVARAIASVWKRPEWEWEWRMSTWATEAAEAATVNEMVSVLSGRSAWAATLPEAT